MEGGVPLAVIQVIADHLAPTDPGAVSEEAEEEATLARVPQLHQVHPVDLISAEHFHHLRRHSADRFCRHHQGYLDTMVLRHRLHREDIMAHRHPPLLDRYTAVASLSAS